MNSNNAIQNYPFEKLKCLPSKTFSLTSDISISESWASFIPPIDLIFSRDKLTLEHFQKEWTFHSKEAFMSWDFLPFNNESYISKRLF